MDMRQFMLDAQGFGQRVPFESWVNDTEAATLEIFDGELNCIIGCPQASPQDATAFMKGFEDYSYLEVTTGDGVIGWWGFKLPEPLGLFEGLYHAKLSEPANVEKYLSSGSRRLTLWLVDRHIQVSPLMRYDLAPEAVKAFHRTIDKQLTTPFDAATHYTSVVQIQHRYSVHQLFERGAQFRHVDKRGMMIYMG